MRRNFTKLLMSLSFGIGLTLVSANNASAQLGGAIPMPLPGLDFTIKEKERDIFGAPIVEVYRFQLGSFTKQMQMEDPSMWVGRYITTKNKRIKMNAINSNEMRRVERFTRYMIDPSKTLWVGDNSQFLNQFCRFPVGLGAIFRPAFQRNEAIQGILGSLDGGVTWIPGANIAGKGWCVPFSPRMLTPGTKEFMVLAFDKSGHQRVRLLVFSIGSKVTRGRQFTAYQVTVTQNVYSDGRRFSIYDLDHDGLVRHCMGIMPSFTLVQPSMQQQLGGGTQVVEGDDATARQEQQSRDRDEATPETPLKPNGNREPIPNEGEVRRPANNGFQEVKVTLVDSGEDLWMGDMRVPLFSFDQDDEEVDYKEAVVNGPSLFKLKSGALYGVQVPTGFAAKLQPGQQERKLLVEGKEVTIVTQRPDRDGRVEFVLQFKQLVRNNEPRREDPPVLALNPLSPPAIQPTPAPSIPSVVAGKVTAYVFVPVSELQTASLRLCWRVNGTPELDDKGNPIKLEFRPSPQPGWMMASKEFDASLDQIEVLMDPDDHSKWVQRPDKAAATFKSTKRFFFRRR